MSEYRESRMTSNVDKAQIERWKKLLVNFTALGKRVPSKIPTFLEITKHGHRELVVSNILRFLFDANEPHGLGNIMTRALYDLYLADPNNKLSPTKAEEIKDAINERTNIIEVACEHSTDSGKRIDLLIETDDHVIGIENKVFADLYNDFSDYKKEIEKCAKQEGDEEDKIPLCFLLGLTKPKKPRKGFVSITFDELFDRATNYLHELNIYNKDKHFLYVQLFYDLFTNMKTLTEDSRARDEFEYFLNKRKDRGAEVVNLLMKLRDYGKNVIKELPGYIDPEIIGKVMYRYDDCTEADICYALAIYKKGYLRIDVSFDPHIFKWRVQIVALRKSKKIVTKRFMKKKGLDIKSRGYLQVDGDMHLFPLDDIIRKKIIGIINYAESKGIVLDDFKRYPRNNLIYSHLDIIGNQQEDINLLKDKVVDMATKLLER